jgi:hypothetical protein
VEHGEERVPVDALGLSRSAYERQLAQRIRPSASAKPQKAVSLRPPAAGGSACTSA